MQVLRQTIRSLGPPVWIKSLHPSLGREALIARWRHADAHVVIPAADTIRVVFHLAGGPQVCHTERGEVTSVRSLPGNISVMLPYVPSETAVTGQADVLQIFLRPESLQPRRTAPFASLPLEALYTQLKCSVLQLLVAAEHPKARPCELAGSRLTHILFSLVASLADQKSHVTHTRSGPGAVRKADRLISRAVERSVSLELTEMAAAAGWSVTHLIRSFRKEHGTTPHQILIKRRLERALDMLVRPDLSIADVADAAGFSSPAHFVATFRRRLGVTPGAYQRALKPTG